jgi:predicted DCC family thiol-disulfide oxidoreductase YuxK
MNIILFDGICNLCNGTVLFLIKHDKKNSLHFAAQQSSAGNKIMQQYFVLNDSKSVVLIKDEKAYYKSDAIIEISKLLVGWPRLFIVISILPNGFRNWFYDIIANNRYTIFGKKEHCSIPSKANEHKFIG